MAEKQSARTGPENSKGKGKERDPSSESSQSITSRLQSSGRLALNAVTGGPDLTTRQSGEKGATSFSSVDKSASIAGEASSHRPQSATLGQSIRTQPLWESSSANQEFNDFTGAEPSLDNVEHLRPSHLQNRQLQDPGLSVAEQEKLDGAAVLDLLNDPSGELDKVLIGAHDETTDDDGLDPQTVAELREALFDSSHREPGWDDMLNFTPDFLHPGASSDDALLHMGTADPEEARNIWLQQWKDVLSSYTDQVWGDLGELVEEARKEVEDLTSAEAIPERKPETKALERLRQILAHVRGT